MIPSGPPEQLRVIPLRAGVRIENEPFLGHIEFTSEACVEILLEVR